MQFMRSGAAVTLLAIGLSAVLSVRAAAAEGVAGVWEYKDPTAANSITFALNADGTGKLDDEAIKYTVEGTTIKVVNGNDMTAYTFKIDGDTMVVSGGDLEKPTTFVRNGGGVAPKKGLGSKIKAMGGGEGVKRDPAQAEQSKGSALDLGAKVGGATPSPAAAPPAATTPAGGLAGKWEATDGTVLEFGEETFLFGGRNLPYKTVDGKIQIAGPAGAIAWPYKVEGDVLTLTLEGVPQTLKRVGGAPVATPKAADAKPAAGAAGPIGTWQAVDGDQLEIRANAMVYRGNVIPAVLSDNSIRLTPNGQSVECPFEVSGDSMNITINGQPLALKRVGGAPVAPEKKADAGDVAKPAADPKSLVGTWESPEGSVIVRADGTVRSSGSEGKYAIDGQFITLSDDKQWVKIPYKLDGDRLILGSGPSKTLTRSAGGPAGVYTVTESSLDPKFFMSITQYLTLYPDGAVGFAKTEGGATRTQVTENFERFRSWKEKQGQGGRSYGRWTADANGAVTIQWSGAFNNATWQGRIDAKTGKLVMPRAGILNEGETLAYEKQ